MTKGTLAQILVDEFDFSGDTSGIEVGVAMGEQDNTTLGATATTSAALLPTTTISQNGYVSGVGDAGDLEEELWARLGVGTSYVAALIGTDVTACPAYVLDGTFGASMQIQSPAAGLMTLNGAWGKGLGGHRGLRVYTGTISATGNQAAIDLGSAGSIGGTAFLFVQAITGTATNASIKVQSSTASGGTYTDAATFTFSAVGGYKAVMSGTVNRWLRLNTASMGGATNFTVVLIAGVAGATE